MWWLTALFASCTVVAAVSAAQGNATAASGIVGAGICTIVCAALAVLERH